MVIETDNRYYFYFYFLLGWRAFGPSFQIRGLLLNPGGQKHMFAHSYILQGGQLPTLPPGIRRPWFRLILMQKMSSKGF